MAWREHAEQGVWALVLAAVITIGAWVRSLVRKIYTNEELIRMMKAEIEHRDRLRLEDREALQEVRDSVKRIEGVLLSKGDK